MAAGFRLIDMRPNLSIPKRNVFFFEDTPDIQTAIDKYIAVIDKGRVPMPETKKKRVSDIISDYEFTDWKSGDIILLKPHAIREIIFYQK